MRDGACGRDVACRASTRAACEVRRCRSASGSGTKSPDLAGLLRARRGRFLSGEATPALLDIIANTYLQLIRTPAGSSVCRGGVLCMQKQEPGVLQELSQPPLDLVLCAGRGPF